MYLTVYDEEGSEIDVCSSDIVKVKVNIEEIDDKIQSPTITRGFVVKLKQLSALDIQKYTTKSNDAALSNDSKSERRTQKRKFVAGSGCMTRLKRRKLNDSAIILDGLSLNQIESPNIEQEKVSNLPISTSPSNTHVTPFADDEAITTIREPQNDEQEKENSNQIAVAATSFSSTAQDTSSENTAVATIPFNVGEVVWGKIRGWPHWPAKVIQIHPRRYEVIWYNDFRVTKLYRSQIYKFGPNFSIFAEKFDTTVGLKEAAEQAMLYLVQRRRIN